MEPISIDDANKMLDLPGIAERIPAEMEGLNPEYATFLVNRRMLVGLKAYSMYDIEFHAMSPRKHWEHLRTDVCDMAEHLKKHGYTNIYTGIANRYKRTQNLARKCGLIEIYRTGEEVIFKCL